MSHILIRVEGEHFGNTTKVEMGEDIISKSCDYVMTSKSYGSVKSIKLIGIVDTEPAYFRVLYTSKYNPPFQEKEREITFAVDANDDIMDRANYCIEYREQEVPELERHQQYRIDKIYRHYIGSDCTNIIRVGRMEEESNYAEKEDCGISYPNIHAVVGIVEKLKYIKNKHAFTGITPQEEMENNLIDSIVLRLLKTI